MAADVVFLLDVDNTLLDGDAVVADLRHLETNSASVALSATGRFSMRYVGRSDTSTTWVRYSATVAKWTSRASTNNGCC